MSWHTNICNSFCGYVYDYFMKNNVERGEKIIHQTGCCSYFEPPVKAVRNAYDSYDDLLTIDDVNEVLDLIEKSATENEIKQCIYKKLDKIVVHRN